MAEFVWCDLSSPRLDKARVFYPTVLGWSLHDTGGAVRGDDYLIAMAAHRPAAGLYTTPQMYQDMGMPSFWMSYVRVDGLESIVERAIELGARCEIAPTAFDEDSRFALIRDPAGAGFTLLEGDDPGGRDEDGRPGRMIWNELHVPELNGVAAFYRDLFDWTITPDHTGQGRHQVSGPDGAAVASIVEMAETVKGPKNYWAVVFAVHDLEAALQAVTDQGGSVLHHITDAAFAMASDDQAAMFCLQGTT